MPELTAENLPKISAAVAGPAYDRSAVTVGIVHVGVGGFHRAHQAMYVDRLMNLGLALDWGICGIGVMPADRAMAAALEPQDSLYTMVVKHADGRREPRVIGSIVDFLYAPDDPERVIELLAAPRTRIVSLTITEGGYNFNQVTHEFEADAPAVRADLTPGRPPSTVFGYVTEALARRRRRGIAPFTVMSCDNIQANGDMARQTFTAFARLRDAELGDWVAANVRFPNSMVDRITPGTTDADRRELAEHFDVDDRWPVVCEPFTQWVLEDSFGAGRPPFEAAGVQVVATVEPYELMKLRLLNGSHQALCYFGYLAGYRFVHEVAQDPIFVEFIRAYMDAEATPTLLPVPGVDLERYKAELIERFCNPEIRDTIARLCAESSDRIPKWLLPVLARNLASGGPISHTSAVVASWARYAEGIDEQGEPIEIVDRLADRVTELVRRYPDGPLALLGLRELFGDLGQADGFRTAYLSVLRSLHAIGAERTLELINAGQLP
jgi:mannitol 2-dehydrogenase